MEQNKILEKIKKLLALAESSNEHEAQVAMLQVQKLMMKHKLSMAEIKEYSQKNPINIKEMKTDCTFRGLSWKSELAGIIADNFQCYFYMYKRYTKRIAFYGKEEDVTVCKIMLEYVVNYIQTEVKKEKYKYQKRGLSTRGVENTYAMGFIEGLKEAFNEQKKAHEEEWGLVLVKDKEVVEAYNKIQFTSDTFKGKGMEYTNDDELYNTGFKNGKKFSITDKISNEGDSDKLALN